MFENCQLILKNCQHPREYNSFVEEFLIDIRATIAAMEDDCPIAKHKSLKDCPVLTQDENSDKNRTKIIVISILVNKIEDITRKTKIDTKVETEAAHKVTAENLTPLSILMKEIKEANRKEDGKYGIKAGIKQDEILEITTNKTTRTFDEATARVRQDKIISFKTVDSDKITKENHREDNIGLSVAEQVQVTHINSFAFEAQDQHADKDILEQEDISE